MNFKACCGLLASKDDEDHDYEDVEQEPLPKPQREADLRKKQQQHMSAPPGIYTAAGYSAKAVSRAASEIERTSDSTDTQKAPWDAGAGGSASASAPTAHGHHPHHRQRQREEEQQQQHHEPRTMKPLTRGSSGGGGGGDRSGGARAGGGGSYAGSRSGSRAKSKVSSSSSRTTSLSSSGNASSGGSGGGRDAYVDARGVIGQGGGGAGGGSVRGRNSGGGGGAEAVRPGTEAMRPGPKGAVGLGQQQQHQQQPGGSGPGSGTGSALPMTYNSNRGSSYYSSKRAGGGGVAPTARRPYASATKFDLAGFVEKLGGGLIVTKINRQGRAKVRTLFYDRQDKMLWWNEPGSRSHRSRGSASSLLSIRKEQPLPVASLVKVKMADELDEPFCFDGDVDKSFQLVFPTRTVDLVAKDAEEASLLARGFQELQISATSAV